MPGPRDRPRVPDQVEQQPGINGRDRPAGEGRIRAVDSAVRVDGLDAQSSADGGQHPAARSSDRGAYQGGYDADAEFKRPVPKPSGYLPDDTGGRASPDGLLRDREPGSRRGRGGCLSSPDALALRGTATEGRFR